MVPCCCDRCLLPYTFRMSTTHHLCTPHLHRVHEYTTSHRRPTSRIYSALGKSHFHCIVVATTLSLCPVQNRGSHTSWPPFCTPADDRPLSLRLGLGSNCKRCPTSRGVVLQFYLLLGWNHWQDAQEQPLHVKELCHQHTMLYIPDDYSLLVYIRSMYECISVWSYTYCCVCVLACTYSPEHTTPKSIEWLQSVFPQSGIPLLNKFWQFSNVFFQFGFRPQLFLGSIHTLPVPSP